MLLISLIPAAAAIFFLTRALWSRYERDLREMEREWMENVRNGLSEQFLFLEPARAHKALRWLGVLSFVTSIAVLSPFPLLLGLGAGAGLPWFILRTVRARRRALFEKQLGAALPQISSILHAGHTFERALESLVRTQPPPISQELEMVSKEIRLGTPLSEALDHLYTRYPSRDLELIARAVGVSKRIGSNLSEVFDRVTEMIRARAALRDRLAALTAQGRMQAWIAIAMPILMTGVLQWIAPGYLEPLFTTAVGRGVLVLSALGMLVGGIWVQKIAKAELIR